MTSSESVAFQGIHSTLEILRPRAGVVVVRVRGNDVGEHGAGPFRELARDLEQPPVELFVDARETRGASLDVSNVWAHWLRSNRDSFHRVHMLTGSRFIQLTADFVRRFSELGDAMFVYTEPASFDEALARATRRP